MLSFPHAQLRLECGQESRDLRVFENAEVALDRRPRGGDIARQTAMMSSFCHAK
jgi:hypothetical protein